MVRRTIDQVLMQNHPQFISWLTVRQALRNLTMPMANKEPRPTLFLTASGKDQFV